MTDSSIIARRRNPDNDLTLIMGILVAIGFPAAGLFNIVRWPFGYKEYTELAFGYNLTYGRIDLPLRDGRVCSDLGRICG